MKKAYYYANAQILRQDNSTGSYYYVHDRLGSIRLMTDALGLVRNSYTYNPFGEDLATECTETTENPYKFTGQYFDSEYGGYNNRARIYIPALMRFTARDPVKGAFKNPMSLHRYLYCENEPISRADSAGLWYENIHQQFGNYGSGHGGSIFDYGRLDRDKPATDIFHLKEWKPLHFKSKGAAGLDILGAIGEGDVTGFEYGMHEFQDTYTHYDRGFKNDHMFGGPGVDDMNWKDKSDVAAYRDCNKMTTFFEGLFFKSNIQFWMTTKGVDLPKSNPWLSTFDSWSSPNSRAGGYLAPIYNRQMGY